MGVPHRHEKWTNDRDARTDQERSAMTSPTVSPQSLLVGSLLALQQSSLLLTDAVVIAESGRYATAVGIALLAREELGRCRILRTLWREAIVAPSNVTVERVVSACETDHLKKQRESQGVLVIHRYAGSQIGDL